MNCIICDLPISKSSIEHIVPESLGNILYVLESGKVCDICNGRFSEFEGKALFNTQFGVARVKNGVRNKKGKPTSFQIDNIRGEGAVNSEKNVLTFYGLEEKDITKRYPDGRFDVTIPDFHKTAMPTAKMLLKIGFESIVKSRKDLLSKYIFTELKDYLQNKSTLDWPFITTKYESENFKSIPKFNDRYNLSKINCALMFKELSNDCLLFHFKYDYINMVINLITRDYQWSKDYYRTDVTVGLYPERFRKP